MRRHPSGSTARATASGETLLPGATRPKRSKMAEAIGEVMNAEAYGED
jgi:hypothetical protein